MNKNFNKSFEGPSDICANASSTQVVCLIVVFSKPNPVIYNYNYILLTAAHTHSFMHWSGAVTWFQTVPLRCPDWTRCKWTLEPWPQLVNVFSSLYNHYSFQFSPVALSLVQVGCGDGNSGYFTRVTWFNFLFCFKWHITTVHFITVLLAEISRRSQTTADWLIITTTTRNFTSEFLDYLFIYFMVLLALNFNWDLSKIQNNNIKKISK